MNELMTDSDWDEIKHFKRSEFTCKCGCGESSMNYDFVFRLERLRQRLGEQMVVTSGYRCPDYNKKIGGSPNSQHTKGRAADIAIDNGLMRYRLVNLATLMLFPGIGVAKDFVHIDNREARATMWTY